MSTTISPPFVVFFLNEHTFNIFTKKTHPNLHLYRYCSNTTITNNNSHSTTAMDMSSYQFVNTLAQCYEQAGVGVVGGLPGSASVATPHEYYGMQYPSCYSPATQAAYSSHQYASMMSGGGPPNPSQQQQQQQPDYSSPPSSATSASAVSLAHRRSPVSAAGGLVGGLSAPPPGGGVVGPLSNLLGGSVSVTGGNNSVLLPQQPNCKYADSNVGSPQDLSTNSSGGTPQPGPHGGGGLGGLGGPKSPESELEDDDEEPSSPLSPSPGASGSSAAAGGATTKKEGGDSKSNPPQIYPWMKRVHLGQSK